MSPFEQHPVRQAASLRRGLRRRLVSAHQPARLEPRLALAGVVALAVTGDALTITGDALANELWIDQVAPNQIRLAPIHAQPPTGLRDTQGTVGHEPLVFSGIRNVVVRLHGGDPEDLRSPVTVLRSFLVDAGTGADFITSFRLDVEGGATFRAGPGSDRIMLEQTRVFGSLSVTGGLGHDIFSLRDATGAAGDVTLVGGVGADSVQVGGGLVVQSLLTVSVGAGDDAVSIAGRVVPQAGMVVGLGTGSDRLRTERSERGGDLPAQDAAIHTAAARGRKPVSGHGRGPRHRGPDDGAGRGRHADRSRRRRRHGRASPRERTHAALRPDGGGG